jgi:hypothetical protein
MLVQQGSMLMYVVRVALLPLQVSEQKRNRALQAL